MTVSAGVIRTAQAEFTAFNTQLVLADKIVQTSAQLTAQSTVYADAGKRVTASAALSALNSQLTVGNIIHIDADLTYMIPAESRSYLILEEIRDYTVLEEIREYII
jgi:hypothetical protein